MSAKQIWEEYDRLFDAVKADGHYPELDHARDSADDWYATAMRLRVALSFYAEGQWLAKGGVYDREGAATRADFGEIARAALNYGGLTTSSAHTPTGDKE